MDLILRAVIIYFFLMLILRISGKRQFSQISSFDFVLLLIVSEAIAQSLYSGEDYSLTSAFLLVGTLVAVDILLSHVKGWMRRVDKVIEGVPVLLMDDGRMIESNLHAERIQPEDILESARLAFGIERLDQTRYAIMERNGAISIIPAAGLVPHAAEGQRNLTA